MSVKIMSAVFDKSKTEGNARLILLALADCANEEGTCWPSISTISNMANVSVETCKKYLSAMEELKLVEVEDRFDKNGRRTSNIYRINVAKLGDDFLDRELVKNCARPSMRHEWSDVSRGDSSGLNGFSGAPPKLVNGVVGGDGFRGSFMKHHKEPKSEPSNPVQITIVSNSEDLDKLFPVGEQGIADAIDSRPPESVQPASPVSGAQLPPKKPRALKMADEAFIAKLREVNPRVDFDAEMKKMNNWLLANPTRKKTRQFVCNWINRVVEKLKPESSEDWLPNTI